MSPRPINPNDDEPVDAHLRAALRHAPDAQALPPAAVSAAILSQARAASRPGTAARTSPSFLARLRQACLALSQPALSAGLASVMVAGVVGLMWWDRVPEEVAAPQEVSRETSAPSAKPDAQLGTPLPAKSDATPVPSVATDEAKSVAKSTPKPLAVTTTPSPPPSSATQQRRGVADEAITDKEAAADKNLARAENAAPAAHLALAETATPTARTDPPTTLSKVAPPPPSPAPAVAAAPVPQALAPEPETSRSAKIAMGSALRAIPSAPLTSLRQVLNLEPQRWRWQKNEAAFDAVTAESQRWLDELDASTAGRWTPQMPARPGSAAPKGLTLRWARDGQTLHILELRPDGVVWRTHNPTEPAWFASLDAALLQRLIESVP